MPLSKQWTVEKFVKHVFAQFPNANWSDYVRRFELVNSIQNTVADQFYGLMWQSYMTPAVLLYQIVGKYGTSAMSWDADANQLTAAMNANFEEGDAGKIVVFRSGNNVYVGIISAFISGTVVTLTGDNLPDVDDTSLDAVIMAGTAAPPGSRVLSLASLPMMRTGQTLNLTLESTATKAVQAVSVEDVRMFQPNGPQNKTKIVWAYSGDEIIYDIGGSLANAGTLTVRYPRVPTQVVADTDYLDLPDGMPIQIALLLLKQMLSSPQDTRGDMARLLVDFYRSKGVAMSEEEIQKKVEALS